jgi:hypothetical protein
MRSEFLVENGISTSKMPRMVFFSFSLVLAYRRVRLIIASSSTWTSASPSRTMVSTLRFW